MLEMVLPTCYIDIAKGPQADRFRRITGGCSRESPCNEMRCLLKAQSVRQMGRGRSRDGKDAIDANRTVDTFVFIGVE